MEAATSTLIIPRPFAGDWRLGELDVALVSSFEYLRNPIYSIVDGVAIASDGPVFSVILAHREPIEQVREIAVDPASETSVNLLRWFARRTRLAPTT